MTLAMYSNSSIRTCFSLTATCNLHLNTHGLYNHLGGCSRIPGDHVSSVGPVPVYLSSTTLALKECQYLLTCLQTVNNNWRLLVVTCDVVCRHSSTVNIDFMSTYVLAIQLFSLLLTGICSLLPTISWNKKSFRTHKSRNTVADCSLRGMSQYWFPLCNGWESNHRSVWGWSIVWYT